MIAEQFGDDAPDEVMFVHFEDSECAYVAPCDEPLVKAAVYRWMDEGADSLVDLTKIGGQLFRVRASFIVAWEVSTAEERVRHVRLGRAINDQLNGDGWQETT